ncbi:MAG: hypothetical protein GX222_07255 [Ruminococcaceae bacterium]|nr:hypothetical protein [Oscillospiraceae bacterium]
MLRKILKLFAFLIVAVVLFYFGYQLVKLVNPSYSVETAVLFNDVDSVSCIGIAVRDEKVINNEVSGILKYRVTDGEKVAADSILADIYPNKASARNAQSSEILKRKLNSFLSASDNMDSEVLSLNTTSNNIYRQAEIISEILSMRNYSELEIERLKLFEYLSVFIKGSSESVDFGPKIHEIEDKIESLESSDYEPTGVITAPGGGYFISHTDGFEGILNSESIDDIIDFDIEKILKLKAPTINYNSCKLVSHYSWFFAAMTDIKNKDRFYVGQKLDLDFKYGSVKSLPVTIYDVIISQDGEKLLIIFSCDYLNSDITSLRIEEADISFRRYKGIKIMRSSLRVIDEEVGVFVKYDNKVRFKKIKTNYETDEYVLVEPSKNDDYLKLYDEVIVQGKDLYVGKSLG